MSVQGFGPIPGVSYKPPVRVGGKVHTISDFHTYINEDVKINHLAKRVDELRQDRERIDQTTQRETESLRDLSAQVKDVRTSLHTTVQMLESVLERSNTQRTAFSQAIEESEEANRKNAQELEDLGKGGVVNYVLAFANMVKKKFVG